MHVQLSLSALVPYSQGPSGDSAEQSSETVSRAVQDTSSKVGSKLVHVESKSTGRKELPAVIALSCENFLKNLNSFNNVDLILCRTFLLQAMDLHQFLIGKLLTLIRWDTECSSILIQWYCTKDD